MSLLAWMVVGAATGILFAALYVRRRYAYAAGVCLGAFGGSVGGFVHMVTTGHVAMRISPWSLVAAIAGAVVLLGGFQIARRAGHGA